MPLAAKRPGLLHFSVPLLKDAFPLPELGAACVPRPLHPGVCDPAGRQEGGICTEVLEAQALDTLEEIVMFRPSSVLFNIFINAGLAGILCRFEGDRKWGGAVNSLKTERLSGT